MQVDECSEEEFQQLVLIFSRYKNQARAIVQISIQVAPALWSVLAISLTVDPVVITSSMTRMRLLLSGSVTRNAFWIFFFRFFLFSSA